MLINCDLETLPTECSSCRFKGRDCDPYRCALLDGAYRKPRTIIEGCPLYADKIKAFRSELSRSKNRGGLVCLHTDSESSPVGSVAYAYLLRYGQAIHWFDIGNLGFIHRRSVDTEWENGSVMDFYLWAESLRVENSADSGVGD